jgi:hypothetical protein
VFCLPVNFASQHVYLATEKQASKDDSATESDSGDEIQKLSKAAQLHSGVLTSCLRRPQTF